MHRYFSHIILILLLALIMGSSLYSSGGIVLLDFILTPHAQSTLWQAVGFPIFDFLSRVLGYEVVSKGFFVAILWSAGYLGILIGRHMSRSNSYQSTLESIGAVFFVINPYAYERMMVQPTIYMGAITLGYMMYCLLPPHSTHYPEQDISSLPQKQAILSIGQMHKRYIWAGAFGGLSFIMMPHASYMIALILGLYIVLYVRTLRDMGRMTIVTSIILLLNLNWLIAPLFGVSNSTGMVSSFSSANLEAFETQALAPLDVWGTNVLLYGFWGERYANHYANVDFLSSMWYVAGILILCLSLYGLYSMWTAGQRKLVTMLGVIAVCALVFGIGIASPLTEGLTRWMIEYVPLWQGYREPQKWIGLLMIVEGIGLIAGVAALLQRFAKDTVVSTSIVMSVLLLFLIWSPGPLMGYHGQLRTTVYPSEFEEVRTELLTTHPDARMLALPWHSYIGCSWMGRPTVSNPIKGLMGPLSVTVADNIEVGPTLYSNSTSTESQDVEQFLSTHDYTHIAGYNYSHILLMRECANSDTYAWLGGLESCTLDTENRYISLYTCHR